MPGVQLESAFSILPFKEPGKKAEGVVHTTAGKEILQVFPIRGASSDEALPDYTTEKSNGAPTWLCRKVNTSKFQKHADCWAAGAKRP